MCGRPLKLLLLLVAFGLVWPTTALAGVTLAGSGTEWKPEELNWYGISQRRLNDVRADSGQGALVTDQYLWNLAHERARDMAVRNYLAPTTPEGVDAGAYMRKDGARYDRWTEFQADDTTTRPEDEIAWEIVNTILNDGGKRQTINSHLDRIGVGKAHANGRSVFVILIAKVSPPPTPTPTPVPTQFTNQQIIEIITAAGRRYGVDPNWLIKIARCESSLNIRAYNPAGPYIGLFQFLPSTFYANGGKNLYDPYDQSDVAARMISRGMARHWGCA